jgi:predicted HAD superfamily Cof-like phosphohydrolase
MMTDQNNQHDDMADSQPEREARRNDESNTIMGQMAGERRREHRRAIELPEPNPVERNLAWFRATGQLPATGEPNIRQAAFYFGMQLEEMAEKVEAVFGQSLTFMGQMVALADALKTGAMDDVVEKALRTNAKNILDGDIDTLWVSIGAAAAAGSDVLGAYNEVATTNEAKRFPDGTYHRHEVTGKVLKPAGWQEPQLNKFVHTLYRKEA